jgi:hypothetical protein
MPTVLASSVIGKVQTIIQDTTGVRWPQSELLGWLNDGQREIAMLRPDACTKITSLALVAGTKQSIPDADGVMLIEVFRNMGADGSTPGNAVRKVPRQILDAQVPNWHASTSTAVVQHYTMETRAPKTFYVYPPSLGTTKVEILYAAVPADLSADTDVLTIDDIYSNSLIDYLLYRAYSKDAEYAGNADRAMLSRKAFENTLGLKSQADAANSQVANIQG